MKARVRFGLIGLLVSLLAVSISFAPQTASAQGGPGPAFSQQELDQMLAPIALYPDALLSQILMAATYPREVVEADSWSRAHPGLKGDEAVRAADQDNYNWDPSVKSLVAFPQILDMLDEKLDWTQRLGDAFLDQQSQVMDTVQDLRQRAYAAGNLRSTDQYRVDPQGPSIGIDEPNPQDYYVPYYDPTAIYGPWWWPTYPPVYWAPWPGYSVRPGFGFFAWGVGIRVSAGFFFGAFDWGQRRVNVVNVNNYYYPRNAGPRNRVPGAWQHDPDHRGGVPYRNASVRQQFGRASAAPETRRDFRGHASSAPEQRGVPDNRSGARGGPPPAATPAQDSRPDARGSRGNRPEERGAQSAPAANPNVASAPARTNAPNERRAAPPVAPVAASRPTVEPRPHAFEGVNQGAQARNDSERGRASAQSAAPSAAPAAPAARPANNAPAPRPAGNAPAPRPAGNAPRGRETDRR
jgi:Protein of unknown function (DUF3300)